MLQTHTIQPKLLELLKKLMYSISKVKYDMKIFFLLIVLIIPYFSFSQLSDKVNSVFNELNTKNEIQSQHIGYSGNESVIYKQYQELDSIANDKEILYMAQTGNDIVKGYMSLVLVDRKSKKLTDLFSNFIKDNKEIHIHTGCTGYNSTLASELYSYLFTQKEKIDLIKNYENDSEESKASLKEYYGDDFEKQYKTRWAIKEIDSLLIEFNNIAIQNDSISSKTLNTIFMANDFKFDNYKRVKFFAYKYPTREIMATLASFQNKNDLPLFHQNIDNSFLAISKFPDESFVKILQNTEIKNTENIDYYEAISSFCIDDLNKIKKNIFDKLSKSDDIFTQEYIQYLEVALKKYSCEYNSNLLLEIDKLNIR
jgi:hypothetical protein